MAHILIVDDVRTIRLKTELVLRHSGRHTVTSVASGNEAVQTAVAEPPDAIVLDIVMAGMDGFATLEALRSSGITCPIIAHTTRTERERGEFRRRGFDAYVAKSEKLDTLLVCIRSLLGSPQHSVAAPLPAAPTSEAQTLSLPRTHVPREPISLSIHP